MRAVSRALSVARAAQSRMVASTGAKRPVSTASCRLAVTASDVALDAAILLGDVLVMPDALGLPVLTHVRKRHLVDLSDDSRIVGHLSTCLTC